MDSTGVGAEGVPLVNQVTSRWHGKQWKDRSEDKHAVGTAARGAALFFSKTPQDEQAGPYGRGSGSPVVPEVWPTFVLGMRRGHYDGTGVSTPCLLRGCLQIVLMDN